MNNQKGLTLVEILAAVVITSLVFALIMGVAVNSQNFFKRSQSDNLSTADTTLLLNQITSDVRSSPNNISEQTYGLLIETASGTNIKYRFDSASNTLFRNDVLQSNNISGFLPKLDSEGNILTITITDSNLEERSTKIVLRKGTNNE